MARNSDDWQPQLPQRQTAQPGRLGERLSAGMLKIILAVIAIYLFLCGFVFAICVFMSNADTSPEISLDFAQHPMRSVLLIAWVAVPFVLLVTVGRGGTLAWLCLRLFSGLLVVIGVYAMLTPHGWFEGFTGTDSVRRGTGIAYATAAVIVLLITAIPGLRQRFDEGL